MENFSARETEWLLELDGVPLASFWPRAFAFVLDWIIVSVIMMTLLSALATAYMHWGPQKAQMHEVVKQLKDGHEEVVEQYTSGLEKYSESHTAHIIQDILIPVLYFGFFLWKGKGRTPGKRLMKIRVVSLVHRHLSLWHSVERALGYGAAALEGGFGFVQYFIHPYRRCVQDRIAETIVVTEAGYQAMQRKLSHPLIADQSNKLGSEG